MNDKPAILPSSFSKEQLRQAVNWLLERATQAEAPCTHPNTKSVDPAMACGATLACMDCGIVFVREPT